MKSTAKAWESNGFQSILNKIFQSALYNIIMSHMWKSYNSKVRVWHCLFLHGHLQPITWRHTLNF